MNRKQGCLITLGATYQDGKTVPNYQHNVPNGHKICQMAIKIYIPNGLKNIYTYQIDINIYIYQMDIK
jgi:hypothetical protein